MLLAVVTKAKLEHTLEHWARMAYLKAIDQRLHLGWESRPSGLLLKNLKTKHKNLSVHITSTHLVLHKAYLMCNNVLEYSKYKKMIEVDFFFSM